MTITDERLGQELNDIAQSVIARNMGSNPLLAKLMGADKFPTSLEIDKLHDQFQNAIQVEGLAHMTAEIMDAVMGGNLKEGVWKIKTTYVLLLVAAYRMGVSDTEAKRLEDLISRD